MQVLLERDAWHPAELRGRNVNLRRHRMEDLPAVVRWYRDPELGRLTRYHANPMSPEEVERVVGQISEKDVMDFARRKLWDKDVAVSAVGSIEGLLDYNRIRNDMSRNL